MTSPLKLHSLIIRKSKLGSMWDRMPWSVWESWVSISRLLCLLLVMNVMRMLLLIIWILIVSISRIDFLGKLVIKLNKDSMLKIYEYSIEISQTCCLSIMYPSKLYRPLIVTAFNQKTVSQSSHSTITKPIYN